MRRDNGDIHSLVIYGIVMYTVLASSLGKLKLPVLFYIVVILTMVGLAWGGWIQNASSGELPAQPAFDKKVQE